MTDSDDTSSERPRKEVRTPETNKVISEVRQLLRRVHPDQLGGTGTEAGVGQELTQILDEVLKFPNDLKGWSHELRERYPLGSKVRLIGLSPTNEVRAPQEVPLRRPEVFLKMLRAYLDTGSIPEKLIADDAEGSGEETEEQREIDATAKMFLAMLDEPESFEHLLGIRGAMSMYHPVTLRNAGIYAKFDAVTEKMIAEEIEIGTPDKLQLANTHLNELKFFNPKIGERLRSLLEAKALESNTEVIMMPSNVTEWERRAAEAVSAGSIDALASIANEPDLRNPKSDEQRYARRTIDTMAKNMFVEACNKGVRVEDFTSAYGAARQFPFSSQSYADDVRTIVEMRAKYFLLGEVSKRDTLESLDELDAGARKFPFSDENRRDLNDEMITKREAIRAQTEASNI